MLEIDVNSGEKVILNLVNPANHAILSKDSDRITGFTGFTGLPLGHQARFLPEGGAIDGGVGACRI